MSKISRYEGRGVSATKDEVHKAISNLDKGLYEHAFCKILPDLVGHDEDFVNIMHADTAGTKTSLAYLYWRETGDLSVWNGIAQDAIVMNLDDMACVGCVNDIVISSTIGRNKHLITADVLEHVIQSTESFVRSMAEFDVSIKLAGGETADVGDIVRTIDVGITAFGRMPKEELVINKIDHGNVIVGFASYGKASYESAYNGGMGSNGLTSARHDVLDNVYAGKYPESYDQSTDPALCYSGSKKLTDKVEIDSFGSIDVGKLILSPTRTYIPLIARILKSLRKEITGMIHCTGGAQAKVKKFIDNKLIIKDNMLPIPPLFEMIQQESNTSFQEMYQVFNMGHRLEIYTDEKSANEMIAMAKEFDIDAQIIGHVENNTTNEVRVINEHGTFKY